MTLTLSAEVLAQGKNTVGDLSAWVAGGEETRNTGGSSFRDNKGQQAASIGGPRSLVVSNHLPDGPGTTGKVAIILHVHHGFDNLDPTYFYVYQWMASDTPTTASLTGTWTCNDHGTYQIRQQGNQVTWTGTSPDSGRTFVNDFVGTIQGDLIVGHFKDRATGIAHSQGDLQIRIVGPNRLEMVKATGGFGGRLWTR